MKGIIRKRPEIDRIACRRLIARFVDDARELQFVVLCSWRKHVRNEGHAWNPQRYNS
jgi:hypothetical protein